MRKGDSPACVDGFFRRPPIVFPALRPLWLSGSSLFLLLSFGDVGDPATLEGARSIRVFGALIDLVASFKGIQAEDRVAPLRMFRDVVKSGGRRGYGEEVWTRSVAALASSSRLRVRRAQMPSEGHCQRDTPQEEDLRASEAPDLLGGYSGHASIGRSRRTESEWREGD